MSRALARHDVLMRQAIETHGGYIFKTIGDAFCAVFVTAPGAIAGALAAQRALHTEDFSAVGGLKVRMALHAGVAEERDGDYFGSTVNRVARLLAVAHGEMPAGCDLRDLGRHRLKDLAQPEHIYQLLAPPLAQTFPPLRSIDNLSNNLPPQLSSFVGRESVVQDIKDLLLQHRLVTLVGTGGAGKTRCAIQVGAELLDGSGDGVWLAELARISDPSLVAAAIARALGIPEVPNVPILDSLLAYLKHKRLLLIIDNCEHVIEQARLVAGAILHHCPNVVLLATSREGLNIDGEQLYRMPSLSMPPAETVKAQELLEFGAPTLFADRAASIDSRFSVSDENAPHIGDICRRLDGIPLAIELAAARVKVLSPQQLSARLNERFRVLTGGDRSVLPRHQTMRALIDWSYDLLNDEERTLFRTLSVFAGTFSLESAAVVCAQPERDEIDTLNMLTSLVDKSLVQTETLAGTTRYRLLESTRQYAQERLVQHGEDQAAARAHALAFAARAEELERAYESTSDATWGAQVEPDLENWRAALEWALTARNDVHVGRRLAGAMRWTWMFFSPAEGMKWVRLAQQAPDDTSECAVSAKLDLAMAALSVALIQYHASYESSVRALAQFQQIGDQYGEAEAGWASGRSAVFLDRPEEGERRLNEALAIAQNLGLGKLTCWILGALGQHRINTGDLDAPAALYEKALVIARGAKFDRMNTVLAGMIAEYRFRLGDTNGAVQFAQEALQPARARKDRRSIINTLSNMAAYLVDQGRYDEAATYAREALILSRDNEARVHLAISLHTWRLLPHFITRKATMKSRPRTRRACWASAMLYRLPLR